MAVLELRLLLIGLWIACVLLGARRRHRHGRRGPPPTLPETNPYHVRGGHRNWDAGCSRAAAATVTAWKAREAAAPC